jgi:E1A/CREB-binding protein
MECMKECIHPSRVRVAPNRRRVYISYLDSVQYFEPKEYRSVAYQAVIVEYL